MGKISAQSNLTFVRGGIGNLDIRNVDVIRCMNVFVYFDRAFRKKALTWSGEVLKPGGLFICGMDWVRSTDCRYTVFMNDGNRLVEKEFAFSVDNIRPIGLIPWYTLHNDSYDAILRARLIGIIRSDNKFCSSFDARMDELLREYDLCHRGEDGYLGSVKPELSQEDTEVNLSKINELLEQDGYVDGAASVLQKAGHDAWRNCVGHIAVIPIEEENILSL